jgi:hypothetical protein
MADKPRVKAPKQRTTHSPDASTDRRRMLVLAGGALVALAAVAGVVALLGLGGDVTPEAAQNRLEAAGCTFETADALEGRHSVLEPGGLSGDWNTDPPTTGPHFQQAAIFQIYDEELEIARVVHNLEHGGVFILYGDEVADETVDALRSFYDDHETGTIMAPLERLGAEFALGAWNADEATGEGNGYLAKCKTFDSDAVSGFFDAFQFRGPERFDPEQLRPGH